jgi:hypothetical protein
MDAMLQSRIQNLIGDDMPMGVEQYAEGGEVDLPAEIMMADPAMEMMEPPSGADLEQAIGALLRERDMSDDPVEREILEGMTENVAVANQAPMAEQAMMLAEQGRGGDTQLAHLRVGEVVLPPEAFEDAEFESAVGRKFEELDLDPEAYVVGAGIASLNPVTGLEEFGWFKKTFKSIKKVAKKVAPVAMLIPGVGTALGAALGGIGGLAGTALGKVGLGSVAKTIGGLAGTALKGVGSLGIPGVSSIAGGASAGSFTAPFSSLSGLSGTAKLKALLGGGPLGSAGSTYFGGPASGKGLANVLGIGSGLSPAQQVQALQANPQTAPAVAQAIMNGATNPTQILNALGVQTGVGSQLTNLISGQGGIASLTGNTGGILGRLGGLLGGSGSGSGLGGLGTLGAVGAAGLLGKLAYDEAKNRKGVALTPLTQEGSTGRYNIEAEIARRTGQPAPNPVEYGLLPTGTIPTLSGGRATPETVEADPVGVTDPAMEETPVMARYGGAIMSARNGGYVMPMAYKKGGNVSTEDFERMNGGINGEGTEISDDVPAMLSDGEFVMTGQAVRGAGAFDLAQGKGGIITLTPNGGESRDGGTALMYEMMDLFAEFADKPKGKAA